jgi:hypothetical protein
MKRIVGLVLALALLCAGGVPAMAADAPGSVMTSAAEDCWDHNDQVFMGMWPYYPKSTSNWWNAVVLNNISEEGTIAKDTLCFVGVTETGKTVATLYGQPIYPANVHAFLKEKISTDANWKDALYFGVFLEDDDLVGFETLFMLGMLGSKSDAGAVGWKFLGEDDDPAEKLAYTYLPGGKWWSSAIVVNTRNSTTRVKVIVVQDGLASEVENVDIAAGSSLLLTPQTLNTLAGEQVWDEKTTAYMRVEVTSSLADKDVLYGWAQYGNGKSSVGYVPAVYDEID